MQENFYKFEHRVQQALSYNCAEIIGWEDEQNRVTSRLWEALDRSKQSPLADFHWPSDGLARMGHGCGSPIAMPIEQVRMSPGAHHYGSEVQERVTQAHRMAR